MMSVAATNTLVTAGDTEITTDTVNENTQDTCTLDGQTITHGNAVMAYQSASVAFGNTCISESRTCNNGTLSGSYTNSSCTVSEGASCTLDGQTITHGNAVTAYQFDSVAFGNTCISESRTCNNGTLSGSYIFTDCTVAPAAACTLNGQNIASGFSTIAYQSANVALGSICTFETRTCSNGSLSGSFTYSSCTIQADTPCTFDGREIAHGSTVTAYGASSVASWFQL